MEKINEINLYALHGFLGEGRDWNSIQVQLNQQKANKTGIEMLVHLTAPDFFSPSSIESTDMDFNAWAKSWNLRVVKENELDRISVRRWIMGYSLGGRLALHAVLDRPDIWSGVILLSTHCGFNCDEGSNFQFLRDQRREADRIWAQRFLNLEWDDVISLWNQQAVFDGAIHPLRREKNFSRQKLAQALENWSLACQNIELLELRAINCPVLWVTGSLDQKFCRHMKFLKENGAPGESIEIPGVGHRLLEAPMLSLILEEFLLKNLDSHVSKYVYPSSPFSQ